MVHPARLQGSAAGPLMHGQPPRSRMASKRTCTCSSQQDGEQHAGHASRRAILAAILGMGLAGQGQAKVAPPPLKKDAYQELQDIIKGRQGSTSLLDSFKPSKVQETVQKKVVAPLQAGIKKAAPAPAKSASGGPSLEVIGGLGAVGLIGAATVANNQKSGGSPAASKKAPPRLGAGTQRIVPQAKQAVKKAASGGTGFFGIGTQRVGAPQKAAKAVRAPQKAAKAVAAPVRKIASKASAAVPKPSKGLFGTKSSAAAGPTGTAKVVRKPAAKAQQTSKQAARKVQQQGGALKDVLTEDTGSTLGAAGILGLAVVVAGALVLGAAPKPPAKPALPEAPRELVPKPAKALLSTAKQAIAQAPKLAPELPKLAPQPPSLPAPVTPPTPPAVIPEMPKVPSVPDLVPEAVKKPVTPSGPPPTFAKPSIPSGPDLRPAVPGPSAAKAPTPPKAPQNLAASVAAAPPAPAPATLAVGGLVVVGLIAAAVAGGNSQGADGASPTPAAPSITSAGGNPEADIAERKKAAQDWIQKWRAKQT